MEIHPAGLCNFPTVTRLRLNFFGQIQDIIVSCLKFLIGKIAWINGIAIHTDTCFFKEFTNGTAKTPFTSFEMAFGKGPLSVGPPFHKQDPIRWTYTDSSINNFSFIGLKRRGHRWR
jgi:hypothetical protein